MKFLASLFSSLICFSLLAQPTGTFVEAYVENNQGLEIPVELQLFTGSETLFIDFITNSNGYGNVLVESDEPWELGIGIIFDCNDSMQISPLIESDIPEVGYQVYFNYCQPSQIFGCTDSSAINYNPFATIDDGSCEYENDCAGTQAVLLINNFTNAEGLWSITNINGELIEFGEIESEFSDSYACLEDGCYSLNFSDVFTSNDSLGFFTLWVGNLLGANDYLMSGESSYNFIVGQGCEEWISGCTDPDAINYNPDAVFDNGSCEYPPVENDLCANAIFIEPGEYVIDNSNAFENEGIWGECWNFGSGEGEQTSVWYTFTTPEEPVAVHIEAFADGTNTLLDTQFGLFLECGGEMIYCDGNSGQGLLSAFSFACGELEPSTDYILMIDGWNGDAGTAILGFEMSSECDSLVFGCTDPNAINYNPDANADDGSCIYEECDANYVTLVIETQNWGYEIAWNITQNGQEIFGDSGYENYSTYTYNICLEDGCYIFEMFDSFGDGWNDGSFTMFLGNEVISSGTLDFGEYGSIAFGVNQDDCEGTIIWGCTDPAAANYNPLATNDDGSCYYIDSCQVYIEQYYITCSSFEFFAFTPWGEIPSNGVWTVNGEIIDDTGDTFYFEFNQPGFYNVCYSSVLLEDCDVPIEACTDIYIGPECFEECYDLEYSMVDSCTYVFSMINLPDSVDSVLWITGTGDAFEAGPTITLDLDTMGVYWICGYIPGTPCPEVCTQIWAEGCGNEIVWGCTDPQAVNYDPLATHDDGSCFYMDSCQVFIEPFYYNCSSYEFYAFTPWGEIANGGVWGVNGLTIDNTDGILYYEFDEPGFYNICYSDVWLEGCNGNTEGCFDLFIGPECFESCPELDFAMVDSCTYEFTMLNLPDDVNTVQWIMGDGTTLDGGPTITLTYDIPGVYFICGYIPDSDCPEVCTEFWVDGCGDELIWGCTDPEAINYDPLANIDDGSCIYQSDCEGIEGALIIDSNYEFSGWWEIMNTETGDYVIGDTIQSGVQYFDICLEDGCYNIYLNLIGNQVAEAWVTIFAGNEDVFFAVLPTGEYSFDFQVGEGCGDQDVLGCTDPMALNYNPEATIDDGSCIYEFDCSIGFAILPDTTGENVIWIIPTFNINNAVEILWDFGDGTTSTEFFPQHEYAGDGPYTLCLYALLVQDNGNTCEANFCADITGALIGSGLTSSGFSINVIPGETLSVENTSFDFELNLFPNPAQESLNISFNSERSGIETFVLYDLTGKVIDEIQIPVAVGKNRENIDIKHLPNGLYVLSLRNISNQRFVKSD